MRLRRREGGDGEIVSKRHKLDTITVTFCDCESLSQRRTEKAGVLFPMFDRRDIIDWKAKRSINGIGEENGTNNSPAKEPTACKRRAESSRRDSAIFLMKKAERHLS
jgi:hypothetical protein